MLRVCSIATYFVKHPFARTRRRPALLEHLEVRQLLSAILANPSFETPLLSANSFTYNPAGASWNFTSTAGIVNVPSSLNAPTAPDGQQIAFLQTNRSAIQY